jgi:hypothetical protein
MDLSIQLRFPEPVPVGEIPEALIQSLHYRGVNAQDVLSFIHSRALLRKCADYIATETGVSLVGVDMKPVRHAPNLRYKLAWSLMRCGVTAKQLGEVVCSERALDRIAEIMMLERKHVAVASDPCQNIKLIDFIQLNGVTKYVDRMLSEYIRNASVSISGIASTLINSSQVRGSDEGVSRKFALIESASFSIPRLNEGALVHENVLSLIGERFPKFSQDDVDPSFVVALTKNRMMKSLFRKHELEWMLLLHRPLVDEGGGKRLLRVNLGAGFSVQSVEIGDELYPKTPGAVLVYSH